MSDIAQTMSETLTVAGQRGHREQRSLNVAIHAIGDPRRWGGLATVAAYPIGDPGQVSVRIVDRRDIAPDMLYEYAFGVLFEVRGLAASRWPLARGLKSLASGHLDTPESNMQRYQWTRHYPLSQCLSCPQAAGVRSQCS